MQTTSQPEPKTERPRGLFLAGLLVGVFLGYLLAIDTTKVAMAVWNIGVAAHEHDLAVREHALAVREREQRCGPVILRKEPKQ